jgi:uncharacterized protein YhaN
LAGVSEVPSSRLGGGKARAQLEEIQSQLKFVEARAAELNAGLWDTLNQVWFAARTGICQALSQAEPLPILLDDPFLTWDDERFRKGMRLLAGQVRTANQVILVTCHEDRHKMIQHDDPEWFDEHFQLVEI